MSKTAIIVQELSKSYRLGRKEVTLRQTLTNLLRFKHTHKKQEFWALDNVNFTVAEGTVMGVIGRNGSGKSTLLKIISKITHPTKGKIILEGRVASLLEVGTGFHPELTGRENIYLNGSILGMKKKEIKIKFDEIVAFSGVEQFLDTPVKFYSSGMYIRLAFSVASFLEPEILIIDEVLAVGDAAFQRKCLGRMKDVAQSGRTVLFVSHNMTAITSLCNECLFLEKGKLLKIGSPSEVIDYYISRESELFKARLDFYDTPLGDEFAVLKSVYFISSAYKPIGYCNRHEKFGIAIEYEILKESEEPLPNFHIRSAAGEVIFVAIPAKSAINFQVGRHKAIVWMPANFFNPGGYFVDLYLTCFKTFTYTHFHISEAIYIQIVEDISLRPHDFTASFPGLIRPDFEWEID